MGSEENKIVSRTSCSGEKMSQSQMGLQPLSTCISGVENVFIGCVQHEGRTPPPQLINWQEFTDTDALERKIIEVLQKDSTENLDLTGALQTLIQISEDFISPKLNILQLIFQVMHRQAKQVQIQTLSLEAIYSLKSHLSSTFYSTFRQEIVNETLSIVNRFKYDQVINQLAARILNDLWECFQPDKIRPSAGLKFAMQVLCNFSERSIQKPCFQLLSKLVQIPGNHVTQTIKENNFWEKIYELVKEKYKTNNDDEELITCLTILKIMSSEISNRYRIIYESKLDLIIQLLDRFPDNEDVSIKVLAILENISREEEGVRMVAMKPLIKSLVFLSRKERLEISYLSSGVLFNIGRNEELFLLFEQDLRRKVFFAIESAVHRWGSVHQLELVEFKSLKVLIGTLNSNIEPSLQLFSSWTLDYLWNVDPDYYSSLIKKENLLEDLKNCLQHGCEEGKIYLKSVVERVCKEEKGNVCSEDKTSLEKIYYALQNPSLPKDDVIKLHKALTSKLSPAVVPRFDRLLTNIFTNNPGAVKMISEIVQKIVGPNSPSRSFMIPLKYLLFVGAWTPFEKYHCPEELLSFVRSLASSAIEFDHIDQLDESFKQLLYMTVSIFDGDSKKFQVLDDGDKMKDWLFLLDCFLVVLESFATDENLLQSFKDFWNLN